MGCVGSASNDELEITALQLHRDRDGEPGEECSSFRTTEHVIHAKATFNMNKQNSKVNVKWISVDSAGVAPDNLQIVEVTLPAVMQTVSSKAELPRDWPMGDYKVVFTVIDDIESTREDKKPVTKELNFKIT